MIAQILLTLVTVSGPADTTGLNLSALPLFWRTVDILESDRMPTDEEWARLFDHPGYRQIQQSGNRATVMRDVMPMVFMPSRRGELDSTLAGEGTQLRSRLHRRVGTHLARVKQTRVELEAYARDLEQRDLIGRGAEAALEYLPAEVVQDVPRPTAYVLLFENNGFGGASIALDLLTLMDRTVEANIAYIGHELHHAYLGHVDRSRSPEADDPRRHVVNTLSALYWEGIASLVDKQSFLDSTRRLGLTREAREDAEFFATAYDETPAMLRTIDSVLTGVADGSLSAESASELRQQLPWGGHPNGMYMALAIERALGRTQLLAVTDPFGFLLTYNKAAEELGLARLSSRSISYVETLREALVDPAL